uniref:Predicted flavoprotein n=1 Tax=uncultured bacterium HF0070_11A08 TaxID=710812 RepID=E0XPG1_9BACT|nr:predicted flavoprotein [uncultured bacterium HF0070_11A08]
MVSLAEGMVWVLPDHLGAVIVVVKSQIYSIQLSVSGIRPTQGKTLEVMQVRRGS